MLSSYYFQLIIGFKRIAYSCILFLLTPVTTFWGMVLNLISNVCYQYDVIYFLLLAKRYSVNGHTIRQYTTN